MMVTSRKDPASISSGLMTLTARAYTHVRLRLSAQQPSEGWLWLVIKRPTETRREPRAFRVRGGGVSEDILLPLALAEADHAIVQEVVLVPSMRLQSVTIASIVFEPHDGSVGSAVYHLISPVPGEISALAPFAMHTLPPPLVGDRSAWTVLVPVVLLAGMIAVFAGDGGSALGGAMRRGAWGVVGAVWLLGFGLTFYYQVVALRVDFSRFGGLDRSQAYAAIDYVPLWDDVLEVRRSLPTLGSVDVVIDSDRPDVVATWNARAAYYLYPIIVRRPAPFKLRYFGQRHPPCGQVERELLVLREGERFCLYGVAR
jgi:hypothetical protein